MRVIEGQRTFVMEDVLDKPLFAHLATASSFGPRDSPVWFLWEDDSFWIIGHEETDTFPKRIREEPRTALGVVQFDVKTGLVRHVGVRGRAEVVPFDIARAKSIFRKYLGPDEEKWDKRLTGDVMAGRCRNYLIVKLTPETVVVRDQSYRVGD